jgi:DNA modification methylase
MDDQPRDLFGELIIADPLLRDKFIVPPFTILDAGHPDWSTRKRAWKARGIKSDDGRDVKTFSASFDPTKYGRETMPEGSIFDPVLCEIMYRWFVPAGGKIIDPFAGGSVRGIVANYLGFKYTGIDIRSEQVDANIIQANAIWDGKPMEECPVWIVGDSNVVLHSETPIVPSYDFVFSCPPYADLEVYSNLPGDISNMEYNQFLDIYRSIIFKAVQHLKKDRFAVFVVGDIRDKGGFYKGFVSDTIKAFEAAGARFYNDIILKQPLGTAMLRANKIFNSKRKTIKVHENVLVFYKGDPDNIRTVLNINEDDL